MQKPINPLLLFREKQQKLLDKNPLKTINILLLVSVVEYVVKFLGKNWHSCFFKEICLDVSILPKNRNLQVLIYYKKGNKTNMPIFCKIVFIIRKSNNIFYLAIYLGWT